MTMVPIISTLLGAVLAVVGGVARKKATVGAVIVGWFGLITGGVFLQFDARLGFEAMPVPVSLAMAGAAALTVVPIGSNFEPLRRVAAFGGALAAAGLAGCAWWALSNLEPSSWASGSLLVGAHWSALSAAGTAGLIGGLLAIYVAVRSLGDSGTGEGVLRVARAYSRDFALRASALVWLAWPIAELIHWRFLGAPGLATRSEWFGLGIPLMATGGLLVGWDLGGDSSARIRSTIAPIWVAAVVLVGIGLSFGFGSPLQLSLGS